VIAKVLVFISVLDVI